MTNRNRCNCRRAPAVASQHPFAREKPRRELSRRHATLPFRIREDFELPPALYATPAGREREMRYLVSKFRARRSSRGSSKLQLPNEVTKFRRALIRLVVIFHSRQTNEASLNENEVPFSSSSIFDICFASHSCSVASTAAPSTLRNPCIFVFTS